MGWLLLSASGLDGLQFFRKHFDEFARKAFFLVTAFVGACGLLLHGLILLT